MKTVLQCINEAWNQKPEDPELYEKVVTGFPDFFRKNIKKDYLQSLVEPAKGKTEADLFEYEGTRGPLKGAVAFNGRNCVKGDSEMRPEQAAKTMETVLTKYLHVPYEKTFRSWMTPWECYVELEELRKIMKL